MSRKAPIITMEELQQRLGPYLEGTEDDEPWFPHDMPEKLANDLSKIEFTFENYEWHAEQAYKGYTVGYETLDNGLQVLFVAAGGDWECPIVMILYWDGKEIRGYIPKDGNPYNKKRKSAWGNNDEDDEEDHLDDVPDMDLVRKDIIKRISII